MTAQIPTTQDPTPAGDARTAPAEGAAEVVRSEERLVTSTRWRVAGSVRVAKRVVTEERTVTVTVRREELVVEHLDGHLETGPADADDARLLAELRTAADGARAAAPVLELVLSEEVVEPVVRVVPRERVRVFVDRVEEVTRLTEDVSREVVEVSTSAGTREATAR